MATERVATEKRVLTPTIGRLLFGLMLQQNDIEHWLDRKIANGKEDQAVSVNDWLIGQALSVYGAVREASFLLAKRCETEVAMAIENATALLKQVIDHLKYNEQDLEEARELYVRLMEFESDLILTVARCTGIQLFEG